MHIELKYQPEGPTLEELKPSKACRFCGSTNWVWRDGGGCSECPEEKERYLKMVRNNPKMREEWRIDHPNQVAQWDKEDQDA